MMSENSIVITVFFVVALALGYWIFFYKRNKKESHEEKLPFSKDLLNMARSGDLESVTERDEEIDRMIHIIMRKTKNNPLLIGQPGVGKTAIVEGLAIRMINGDVPIQVQKKHLFALDISSFIADTKFRGELEKRMVSLLNHLEQFDGNVMLFIDEIHMLEQLRSSEGALHIGDMLKPALARGRVQVIGATTWKEYEESIQKDQALDRRFQPVLVDEPTPDEALKILKHLRPVYEEFHGVSITDEALAEAVRISDEKINDRYLPDKAIDLLDEAAAKVSIETSGSHRIAVGLVHASAKNAESNVDVKDIQDVADQWIIHSAADKRRDARKED